MGRKVSSYNISITSLQTTEYYRKENVEQKYLIFRKFIIFQTTFRDREISFHGVVNTPWDPSWNS